MIAGPHPPPTPFAGRTRLPRWLPTACAAAVLSCAAWAFWPLPARTIDAAPYEVPPTTDSPRAALDLDAFRAPVWIAAAPAVKAPAPPPPPPLRLQLLAIVRDGGALRAALYDPDSDRLFVVSSGETIGGRTVETVTADRVDLKDAFGVRTLSLASAGGTGERP